MSYERGRVVASIFGLVFAIASTVLFFLHLPGEVLAGFTALCAAAGLLKVGPSYRSIWSVLTLVFVGLAGGLVGVPFYGQGGPVYWPWLLAGFVSYLIGATAFGFAAQAQGLKVGARTALLLLVLLAVIPVLNVLGLLGILVSAIVRSRASEH